MKSLVSEAELNVYIERCCPRNGPRPNYSREFWRELYDEEQNRHAKPQPTIKQIGDWWVGKNCSIRVKDGAQTITTWQTGKRMIAGVACTPALNKNGMKYDLKGGHIKFPVPLVCNHHDLGQIGDIVSVTRDQSQIVVRAVVWDSDAGRYAWENLIKSGQMRGLSTGTTIVRKTVVDRVDFIEKWLLREVSICRSPANEDCWLEVTRDE